MKKKAGLADSPFFDPAVISQDKQAVSVFPQIESAASISSPTEQSKVSENGALQHGVVVSRYHDTVIETLRRSVKEFGKEAATHRFTLAEKRAISTIIHALEMQGIRTTENEITRIAVNFITHEYNQKGKDSLLSLVLQALNK